MSTVIVVVYVLGLSSRTGYLHSVADSAQSALRST